MVSYNKWPGQYHTSCGKNQTKVQGSDWYIIGAEITYREYYYIICTVVVYVYRHSQVKITATTNKRLLCTIVLQGIVQVPRCRNTHYSTNLLSLSTTRASN